MINNEQIRETCIRKFVSCYLNVGCDWNYHDWVDDTLGDWKFINGDSLLYKGESIAVIHEEDEKSKNKLIVIVQPSFKQGVKSAIEYLKKWLDDFGITYCYLPLADLGLGCHNLGANRVPYIINEIQIKINNAIFEGDYTKKETRNLYADTLEEIAYFAWDEMNPSFNQNMDRGEMEGTYKYLRTEEARKDALNKKRKKKIS